MIRNGKDVYAAGRTHPPKMWSTQRWHTPSLSGSNSSPSSVTKTTSPSVFLIYADKVSDYNWENGSGTATSLHPRIAASMIYAPGTMTEMIATKDGRIVATSSNILYSDVVQVTLPSLAAVKALFATKVPISLKNLDLWLNQKAQDAHAFTRERLAELDENVYHAMLYEASTINWESKYQGRRRDYVYAGQLTIHLRDLKNGKGEQLTFVFVMSVKARLGKRFASGLRDSLKGIVKPIILTSGITCFESVVAIPFVAVRTSFPLQMDAWKTFLSIYKSPVSPHITAINAKRKTAR